MWSTGTGRGGEQGYGSEAHVPPFDIPVAYTRRRSTPWAPRAGNRPAPCTHSRDAPFPKAARRSGMGGGCIEHGSGALSRPPRVLPGVVVNGPTAAPAFRETAV
eukprot:gene31420-47399_t